MFIPVTYLLHVRRLPLDASPFASTDADTLRPMSLKTSPTRGSVSPLPQPWARGASSSTLTLASG
jgi:hypothetical protein